MVVILTAENFRGFAAVFSFYLTVILDKLGPWSRSYKPPVVYRYTTIVQKNLIKFFNHVCEDITYKKVFMSSIKKKFG